MMATGSGIEDELGWSETVFFLAVAVAAVGLALLGWPSARRAARQTAASTPWAGTSMLVPPGDVGVVDLREGQLVFAARDARQVKEFVEARVRRWASAGRG